MFRRFLAFIGLIEVLYPEKLIDTFERIALDNLDECELKSWAGFCTRLEGVIYLFLAWRGETSYSAFKVVPSGIGLLALVYPRRFIDISAAVGYADAEAFEWKPWGTRWPGLLAFCTYYSPSTNYERTKHRF